MNRSLEEEKEEQRIGDKRSYRDLERRVAARTKELAAFNAIAAVVSQSLDLDDVLKGALDKRLQVMEIEAGGIYVLDKEAGVLAIAVHRGVQSQICGWDRQVEAGRGLLRACGPIPPALASRGRLHRSPRHQDGGARGGAPLRGKRPPEFEGGGAWAPFRHRPCPSRLLRTGCSAAHLHNVLSTD